jgi:AcrR family transcriptional regulator
LVHVRGFNNTSVDEILRESGVGKGNFYYYFRSKDELGFAILDRGLERIGTDLIEKNFNTDKDPWEHILDFLDSMVERARQGDCTGGCLLRNLAVEMSDIHEEFRRRLNKAFNQDWRSTETIYQSATRAVPRSAKVHAVRGHFLLDRDRPGEAIEALEEAARIDPSYELAYLNLGVAYARMQRWPEAEASLTRGLTIAETALGPEHPLVAETLGKLGVIHVIRGQAAGAPASSAMYAQAEAAYRRALAILEKTLGRDHQSLAEPLENYAALLRQTNRGAEARARAIRAT